jgi:predicted transcriptional regulator of viral defense system
MARKNKLDISLPFIEKFFNKFPRKSFTENKFAEIFDVNKHNWKVPANKYPSQVLNYLVNKGVFKLNTFFDNSNEKKYVYSWKTQDDYTVISGLKSNSYFAFYSSMFLHQLTLQIPKTVYLNYEHGQAISSNKQKNILTQGAIDKAFSSSQRKSTLSFTFKEQKIILTNGKYVAKLGVIKSSNKNQSFEYTDLERTLIDIAVRPVYAGGVFEVLEAYKLAKKQLNVDKMKEYLKKLKYLYPYEQVIGFYLEKAGYAEKEVNFFKKEQKFKFYLTYDIRQKEFSKKWNLYYPKGF